MRYLFVGDPHAEPTSLKDCTALARHIITLASKHKATVVMAGDLYHTHAIVHAMVQYYWWSFFESCRSNNVDVIVLKGNHDIPGIEGSKATALIAHISQCHAVLYEPVVYSGVLFCPYTSAEQLVKWSNDHPECKTLFCHQTFDGSVYDNGFYAGDGVDPEHILQDQVISGHIHTPQEFGKVWYPGAPRWRTLSDANVDRAVWLLDFDDQGVLQGRQPFDTGAVCRRIYVLEDTEAAPLDIKHDPRHQYNVLSKGPRSWLETRKPVFEGWSRWRGVRTDSEAAIAVRESDGVAVAFKKFLESYQPRYSTDKDELRQLVKERIGDL